MKSTSLLIILAFLAPFLGGFPDCVKKKAKIRETFHHTVGWFLNGKRPTHPFPQSPSIRVTVHHAVGWFLTGKRPTRPFPPSPSAAIALPDIVYQLWL